MKNQIKRNTMNNNHILLVALWLALCISGRLLANEPKTELESGEARLSVKSFGLEDSTVGDGNASYALAGFGAELEYGSWQFGVAQQRFDWRNTDDFIEDTDGRDPWESFTRLHLGFSHSSEFTERWSGEVMTGITGEFEEEIDHSFSAYLAGYGVYQMNESLFLMVGAFYSQHQEIQTAFDFIPILGLAWNPEATEGLSIQLGVPVTRASWHFNENTRLMLELNSLEGGVARLADDSPVRPGGYAERVSNSVYLRFETQIGNGLELSAGIGHSVEREIKLYDSDGGNSRSEDIEQGMGIEISLSKSF